MTHFILNNTEIQTTLPNGTLLLDFIRYYQQLTGTKIGCREGDCGACTVLAGELVNGKVSYSSATSCLMPLGNAHRKHIVTIEGINLDQLNKVQQAFADEGATQCGFCTPGFIVSLAGFCIKDITSSYESAIDSMNGNICRCTGYKSIERAAQKITNLLQERSGDPIDWAVNQSIIPPYFQKIGNRLQKLSSATNGLLKNESIPKFLGGGTDLYVQQHDTMVNENIDFMFDKPVLNWIKQEGNICHLGGSVTVTDMAESPLLNKHFPALQKYIRLISSTQIRNMATIAGNFSNASPIGDLTIFFLSLDARLLLTDGKVKRQIPLRSFYNGYKQLNKKPDEFIETISFELPLANGVFNFEKVSKRTWLDIASVNTALYLEMNDDAITSAGLSAGGVAPIPLFLNKCSEFLTGKRISAELISELIEIAMQEISPISDARGSMEYKRLLLSQLIKAHFITLFPSMPLPNLMPV
ncbi:MAG TPA: FAD binding domain-containing protein [Ferruginibacter sp.]|nr:FAD binding domain-containing protein [Ferruginibacter sp.]